MFVLLNANRRVLSCLLIAVFSAGMVACASKAELEERRQNAYDVSGSYKTLKSSGSEVEIGFEIVNEQGRHDIVVNLDRLSAVTEKERAFLNAKGLDPNRVITHFGNQMVLGRGVSRNHIEGGENISDDFGESSRFQVCTERFVYDRGNELYYCLSGYARKGASSVEGSLTLHWSHSEEVVENGQKSNKATFDSLALPYKTTAGLVLYKQYFGSWSGEVQELAAGLPFGKSARLQIAQVGAVVSDVGVSVPRFATQLDGLQKIDFGGETFTYDATASQGELESLKTVAFPVIMVIYRSTRDPNHTISMVGVVWSLGDLSGAITLDRGGQKTELATFRLKKN